MIKYLLCAVFLLGSAIPMSFASQPAPVEAPLGHITTHTISSDADVAARLAALTSLAVSPILVGGGRSALVYWRASPAERKHLPWTASPWYWGALLAIGGVFFIAHIAGTSVPIFGKIVEAARSIEGKASLIYASPLFLAAGTELLGSIDRSGIAISPISSAVAATGSYATSPTSAVFGGLLGLAIFVIVWLTNQAFHTIVLLSPSMVLGSCLRALHLLVLGVLLIAAAVSPALGAVLALILIFICARLAGWSFRLSVFGTVFAWDLLTFRREQGVDDSILAFSSPSLSLPSRTLGRLVSRDGAPVFVYRRWLIGPSCALDLARGNRVLRGGVFYPSLLSVEGAEKISMLAFPPRYRGSEKSIASIANCDVLPSVLKGGMSAASAWMRQS